MINITIALAATCLDNDDTHIDNISIKYSRLTLKSDNTELIILWLNKKYHNTIILPIIRDITVANAAHPIPICKYSINIASKIMLLIAEINITIIAILGCPIDLIILLFHILKVKNTIPNNNTEKYCIAYGNTATVAPKNNKSGFIKSNHKIVKNIDMLMFVVWNVPKVLDT